MTPGGWAARKAKNTECCECNKRCPEEVVHTTEVVKLLDNEHARTRRIVKAEIKRVKLDQHTLLDDDKALILRTLEGVLELLQKGRR